MKKQAFTLAETLITLTILGVITAITVPSLIRQQTEKATVTKVIKMYSILNDAWANATYENEGNFVNLWTDSNDSTEAIPKFYKYLKVEKICKDNAGDCFVNSNIVSLDGSTDYYGWKSNGWPSAKLHDGTSISAGYFNSTCTSDTNCFDIYYDTNGKDKGPNKMGVDIFKFWIYANGVVIPQNNIRCSLSVKSVHNGGGCTDWIIKNKNMDYLHDKNKGYSNI